MKFEDPDCVEKVVRHGVHILDNKKVSGFIAFLWLINDIPDADRPQTGFEEVGMFLFLEV